MFRLALSLLLALILVLDGAAAAWSFGALHVAGQGDSGPCAEHALAPAAQIESEHAHHPASASQAAPDCGHSSPGAADAGCCDGSACACGCVLPLAVLLSAWSAPAQAVQPAPAIARGTTLPLLRLTPPFRPPAA